MTGIIFYALMCYCLSTSLTYYCKLSDCEDGSNGFAPEFQDFAGMFYGSHWDLLGEFQKITSVLAAIMVFGEINILEHKNGSGAGICLYVDHVLRESSEEVRKLRGYMYAYKAS